MEVALTRPTLRRRRNHNPLRQCSRLSFELGSMTVSREAAVATAKRRPGALLCGILLYTLVFNLSLDLKTSHTHPVAFQVPGKVADRRSSLVARTARL